MQVTTITSTPSATYLAVVAAPLLDSSSGWACTAMRRRGLVTGTSVHHVPTPFTRDQLSPAMQERYGLTRKPLGRRIAVDR